MISETFLQTDLHPACPQCQEELRSGQLLCVRCRTIGLVDRNVLFIDGPNTITPSHAPLRFKLHTASSYRQAINTLNSFAGIHLIVDRYFLSSLDKSYATNIRRACKSIAATNSIPWITAEVWESDTSVYNFVHEWKELVDNDQLYDRLNRLFVEGFSKRQEDQEKMSGLASGRELLHLLKFLSSHFKAGFLYLGAEELSACLFFENGVCTQCFVYSRLSKSLKRGGEALTKLIKSFLHGYSKSKLHFQFFEMETAPQGRQEPPLRKRVEELITEAIILLDNQRAYAQPSKI